MYAVDMLGALGLPEDLIQDVRGMLGLHADDLENAKPGAIGDVFGGSNQGAQLSHHAAIARRHVAEAVIRMADGLRGYSVELAGHAERMGDTDAQNAVDLTRIESYTACVAAPDFTDTGSCQAPSTGDDD